MSTTETYFKKIQEETEQGKRGFPGPPGPSGYSTGAEVLAAIKTVDGAGSGLDADKLDGQEGTYYAPANYPVFTKNIQIGVYPHIGERYSAMDLWIGENVEVNPGDINGVVLATNETAAGAMAMCIGANSINIYRWTPAQLSGKVAGDAITIGTPDVTIDSNGISTPLDVIVTT